MNTRTMERLAKVTRPFMRRKTPVAYRVCKLALKLLSPPDRPDKARRFVADVDAGRMVIDTSSSLEYHIFWRGTHEPEIVRLIEEHVQPGMTCLDVGANVGSHTLVLARAVGPGGKVVAVEAHPDIHPRLEQNLALNGVTNVDVVRAALSDQDGTASFYAFDDDAWHKGISSLLPDERANSRIEVPAISGETLLREHDLDPCHFIKVDVEGAESLVLRQLRPLIERDHPVLIFEYRDEHWAKFGDTFEGVLGPLRELGYRFFTIWRNTTRPLTGEVPASCEVLCLPGAR